MMAKLVTGGVNFVLDAKAPKRKDLFLREALLLKQSHSLCSSMTTEQERHEAAYMEAVRSTVVKITYGGSGGKTLSLKEINAQINELLKASIQSQGVISLFDSKKADENISLFDPAVLDEISKMKEKNIAVEILKKLMAEQVSLYKRTNVVQSQKFSEKITQLMNSYYNGLITNEEVIKELLKTAQEITELYNNGKKLGLTQEELAFYDALTKPENIKDFYQNNELIDLTRELTEMLRKNRTIDWHKKEDEQMKFCNFLLRVDGIREASLEDMKDVVAKGNHIFRPQKQKYLYSIDMDVIEERFFWMASDYDDAVRFRDYVINKKTGEKMPNPRSKEQVEPRQQFFACYDAQKHFLYMNDYNKKGFVEQYLSDTLQKEFRISNIYTSLDDFCKNIKTIRGFQYTQVDNVFSRGGTLFSQVGNIWGQDLPSKLQLKISYGDIPIHGGGKGLVDRICRHREEFEDVVIIGCDESGIEQTFDFSSVLKHFLIQPTKDENEHFEPDEVRELLLAKLR